MTTVRDLLNVQMQAQGWLSSDAGRWKAVLYIIFSLAVAGAVFGAIVAGVADTWLPLIGVAALGVLAIGALWMVAIFSNLSRHGQEAALPWKAYREGLKVAGGNDAIALDLDAVLPDVVAMNLGPALNDRLKGVTESGVALRAFAARAGAETASFPFWVAYSSTVGSGGSSSTTVSSGGAGGGGGAAGST